MRALALSAAMLLVSAQAWASLPGPRRQDPRVVDVTGRAVYAKSWQRSVVREGAFRRSHVSLGAPAISSSRGRIYVATSDGVVEARALGDGASMWRRDFGTPFSTTVSLHTVGGAERLLVGTLNGRLLALDPSDGTTQWAVDITGSMLEAPIVVDGGLVLATSQGRIMSLVGDTGETRWNIRGPTPRGLTIHGHAGVALCGDTLVTGFVDGTVAAFRAKDGVARWSGRLADPEATFNDADATPLCGRDRIFAAGYGDGIAALRLTDGEILWKRPLSGVTSLAMGNDGTVYAASAEGTLVALAGADGAKRFRTGFTPGPVSPLHVHRGAVAFSAGEAGLLVVNATSGIPVQATPVGARVEGSLAAEGDILAVLSSRGQLAVFKPLK